MDEVQAQTERIPNGSWWVRTAPLAHALGVSTKTILRYIKAGILDAMQVQVIPHYTDVAPRKTARGHWRVSVASVERMLAAAHYPDDSVRAVRRWLKREQRT